MSLTPSRSRGGRLAAATLLTAALGAGPLAAGAGAQATRTWISGVGDDANACSRAAPCKTIAGAFVKTAAGGEVNAMDPGGFGAVTLNQPITIDFSAVGTGGILNSGVTGVVVNAPSTADVVLRGLDIAGGAALSGACPYGGVAGVRVVGGHTVRIEDSTISSQGSGIQLVPTTAPLTVLVDHVDVSNTCTAGIAAAPAGGQAVDLTVRDSTIFDTGTAVAASTGAHVRLVGSTITGNAVGLDTSGGGVVDAYGEGQVFGNVLDGSPTAVFATAKDGATGPAGPAGPTGATGAAGPAGPAAYRLLVLLAKPRVSVARGQGLALDYVSTSAATATLRIAKGGKVVATVRHAARLGRNTIVWSGRARGRAVAPGRYRLGLSVASADGQRGSTAGTLTVTARSKG